MFQLRQMSLAKAIRMSISRMMVEVEHPSDMQEQQQIDLNQRIKSYHGAQSVITERGAVTPVPMETATRSTRTELPYLPKGRLLGRF